jgi:hypothetical protein
MRQGCPEGSHQVAIRSSGVSLTFYDAALARPDKPPAELGLTFPEVEVYATTSDKPIGFCQ